MTADLSTEARTLVSNVRRTTIVTSDMPASLGFYQSALGFQVWYDAWVEDPAVTKLLGVDPGVRVRVVILTSGKLPEPHETVEGMVGLMAYDGQPLPKSRPLHEGPPLPGEIVMMFHTDQMVAARQRLLDAGFEPGAPEPIEIPGRPITHEMACRDPNGIRVTLVQFGALEV